MAPDFGSPQVVDPKDGMKMRTAREGSTKSPPLPGALYLECNVVASALSQYCFRIIRT